MVVVRESPKAKHSPKKNLANWPPKSPYEALLSSPSGRKKWQDRQDLRRRTPSPSPRKPPQSRGKSPQDILNQLGDPFESDQDDEDEETLKLKLQAIEAKLKLKKLQQAKDKRAATDLVGSGSSQNTDPDSRRGSPKTKRPRLAEEVQVPVSPVRTNTAPPVNKSPARVLLGIDKGLRAEDVSLKRPRPGSGPAGRAHLQKTPPRVKSFTERLAESRDSEIQKQEKAERIQNARGRSFGLQNATDTTSAPAVSKSKADHSSVSSRPSPFDSARKKSSSSTTTTSSFAGPSSTSSAPSHALSTIQTMPKPSKAMSAEDALTLEPYSGLHLSKRLIQPTTVSSVLSSREVYPLPRLLKEIKSPDYDPPDCESDYVVLGIIASKSSPYDIKSGPSVRSSSPDSTSTDKKFLVLKLTDLKWELDLFLFSTAFSKYWKLSPGTVIAVLNPGIMPPRPHARDTGRFSLKLSSSEDEILELGTARDLKFCTSRKKDGQLCNAWIDGRRTEHCDFHVNLQVDKARSGRMEMNSIFRYAGQKKREGSMSPGRRQGGVQSRSGKGDGEGGGKYKGSQRRDWESGEMYYMGPSTGAAKLLDNEDVMAPEKMRLRLKEKEKERELRRKLGELGNGAGAEYLRAAKDEGLAASSTKGKGPERGRERGRSPTKRMHSGVADDADFELSIGKEEKLDAASLGLVRKATDIRLSPVKGRKRAPHEMAEAIGWSGAFKRGVYERKAEETRAMSPEKGQTTLDAVRRSISPKKKARFALEKGIREPGRESLGDAIGIQDDSDDDLDII
ncbi:hypothetical protein B9Z65_4914 [Elsinoe australis]|uniref:Uncharacterized protein n=1 Tax=Elsinoe australis TaxID=40998 RepID=A0A2P8A6D7_9PEZI|nr:hypothetical protein B9Z65_4914 [Elsinoe australis]